MTERGGTTEMASELEAYMLQNRDSFTMDRVRAAAWMLCDV